MTYVAPLDAPARPASPSKVRAAVTALRTSQWSKNTFVLAPLVLSKEFDNGRSIGRAVLATLAFCTAASAVYVFNDWQDRARDAVHPEKSSRPFAAGLLGRNAAVALLVVCLVATGAFLAPLGWNPGLDLTVGCYLLLNVAYSLGLREINLADIVVIASGFVLRVVGGSAAIHVEASSWIILATGLLALLLALGKRRTDLVLESASQRATLAHYSREFIDAALAAISASVIAFYALFTVSDYSLGRFGSEHLYVTTFPVAIGVIRYLQVVITTRPVGSPTDIALKDRPLRWSLLVWATTFALLAFVIEGSP